jgi:hypothetical protein
MLFGHLAVSVLLHRYLGTDLKLTVAGGIAPDIVDKTLCQVLRLTPDGRMLGHSLLAFGLSTAAVGRVWGWRAAWSWALGYMSHLVGDLGGLVPWLYPLVSYDFSPHSPQMWQIVCRALSNPMRIGVELGLAFWAACVLRRAS